MKGAIKSIFLKVNMKIALKIMSAVFAAAVLISGIYFSSYFTTAQKQISNVAELRKIWDKKSPSFLNNSRSISRLLFCDRA